MAVPRGTGERYSRAKTLGARAQVHCPTWYSLPYGTSPEGPRRGCTVPWRAVLYRGVPLGWYAVRYGIVWAVGNEPLSPLLPGQDNQRPRAFRAPQHVGVISNAWLKKLFRDGFVASMSKNSFARMKPNRKNNPASQCQSHQMTMYWQTGAKGMIRLLPRNHVG